MRTRGRRSYLSNPLQLQLQAGQRRQSIPFEFKLHKLDNEPRALQQYPFTHKHYQTTSFPVCPVIPASNTLILFFRQSTDANGLQLKMQVVNDRMVMMVAKFWRVRLLMCKFVFYVEQFLSNVILIFLKEGMTERFKGTSSTQSQSDRVIENELLQFITFVKRAPLSIQRQLYPYCYELKREFPADARVKAYHDATFGDTEYRPEPTANSENLIKNLFRILQLRYLPTALNKTIERVEADRSKPQQRSKQQIFGKGLTFERVEMLHPEYDTYYKMSKQEREHHLPQHHPRNRFKEFYTEPRYLVRMEELAHFKSNQKLKGDILFLHYEGNIITGSKAYAVARERAIEHWEMSSPNFYPTPVLNIPAEPDGTEKKDEEEKKPKEPKPEPAAGTKFCLNHVFTGHQEKITCLSFSQDQFYLISGSADRTVKLWCLRMRTCLGTYRGHQRTIWDVHFSPHGYYFLSGSADGCMILWKTDEPHAQRVYNHKADVLKVSIAKDPSFVVSAGEDCTIKIWKTLQAQLIRELRLGRPVVNLNLGFSGSLLVAVESDGRISIFDLMKGETVNSFYFYEDRKGKEGPEVAKMRVHDVCLSEDERELSCVTSKYVVIYSMERLEMKVNNNIYTFFQTSAESSKVTRLPPKEIIYMGIETNLTYCSYQHKNVLVVAGSGK